MQKGIYQKYHILKIKYILKIILKILKISSHATYEQGK